MRTQDIDYIGGGKALRGYLADGSGGASAPGVLLVHQGGGLAEHTRERARMVAELGCVAFALDLYGETATGRDHAMQLIRGLAGDPALLNARVAAGLDVLKAQPTTDPARLAAIGYCFGGWTVLQMAFDFPELGCVVSFHPGLSDVPERSPAPVKPKVLVCAGAEDPLIPADALGRLEDLLTASEADWRVTRYGGAGHSFTDRSVDGYGIPHFSYHGPTDRRSWAAMRALFDETFSPVAETA